MAINPIKHSRSSEDGSSPNKRRATPIQRLASPDIGELAGALIRQNLENLPENERTEVADLTLTLLAPTPASGGDRAATLQAISKVHPDQRERVVLLAKKLLSPGVEQPERTRMLEAIAGLEERRQDPLVNDTLLLTHAQMFSWDKREVLEKLATLPEEERAEIVQCTDQLVTPEMDGKQIAQLLTVVAELSTEERFNTIVHAFPWISPQANGWERANILRSVVNISQNQGLQFLSQVFQFISPVMARLSKAAIVNWTAGISSEQRNLLLALVAEFIPSSLHQESKELLIAELLTIRPDRVPQVLSSALRAILPATSVLSRLHLLYWLNEGGEELLQNILKLAPREMAAEERELVFRMLFQSPLDEGRTILAATAALIHEGISGPDRATLIQILLGLPADDRDSIVLHTQRLLLPQMQAGDLFNLISEVTAIPPDRRHLLNWNGIDVHEGDRDPRTRQAIELLRQHQGPLSEEQMFQARQEFETYLNEFPNGAQKVLAAMTAFAPKGPDEDFGPLIDEVGFSILGLPLTGLEILGRHWIFASARSGDDQTNARNGVVSALANSYDDQKRICNQGKTQRLVVAVLQGRLAGVNIEGNPASEPPSTPVALRMFFEVNQGAHRNIGDLAGLLAAAGRFCDENPLVIRDDFLREIRAYAASSGIEQSL